MSDDVRTLQEEALVLSDELARRRQNDPLYLFKPHDKQRTFIEAVLGDPRGSCWFIAANRAGKSDAGAYIGATLARFGDRSDKARFVGGGDGRVQVRDRATSGWVSGLTFPLVRDTIAPKYFDNGYVPPGQPHEPFIPKREIERWDVEGQILKLKNGSIIGFKSADSGPAKYQGAEKDWFHMDEEHPKRIFEEAVIRVGTRALRFFCTATLLPPEGVVGGVTWIYTDIIRPWMEGRRPMDHVFGSSIYDNPHILKTEIARLESIYPPGSLQWRIRLNGEWLPGLSGARAYPSFERTLHVKELHGWNARRPLAWIWDFNVSPMVSLIGQREALTFRIYRELVMEEASIPEMVDYFRRVVPAHGAEIHIFGDATGKHRHAQSRHDNYTVIRNLMMTYGVPVRMKVPETNPPQTSRINAVNMACKTEQGEIRIEVDKNCVELIADLDEVLLDEKGGIRKTSNRKDPYFRRTHTSDAFGYWVAFEAPVMPLRLQAAPSHVARPGYSFS